MGMEIDMEMDMEMAMAMAMGAVSLTSVATGFLRGEPCFLKGAVFLEGRGLFFYWPPEPPSPPP